MGGMYGVIQVFENLTGINKIKGSNKFLRIAHTLMVFSIVSTLWVFFKASTFSDAWYLLGNMFTGITDIHGYVCGLFDSIKLSKTNFVIIGSELILLFIYDYLSLKENVIEKISSKPILIRWTIYVFFVLIIVQLSNKGEVVKFVYAGF